MINSDLTQPVAMVILMVLLNLLGLLCPLCCRGLETNKNFTLSDEVSVELRRKTIKSQMESYGSPCVMAINDMQHYSLNHFNVVQFPRLDAHCSAFAVFCHRKFDCAEGRVEVHPSRFEL